MEIDLLFLDLSLISILVRLINIDPLLTFLSYLLPWDDKQLSHFVSQRPKFKTNAISMWSQMMPKLIVSCLHQHMVRATDSNVTEEREAEHLNFNWFFALIQLISVYRGRQFRFIHLISQSMGHNDETVAHWGTCWQLNLCCQDTVPQPLLSYSWPEYSTVFFMFTSGD
jgi:hypothetical protein